MTLFKRDAPYYAATGRIVFLGLVVGALVTGFTAGWIYALGLVCGWIVGVLQATAFSLATDCEKYGH